MRTSSGFTHTWTLTYTGMDRQMQATSACQSHLTKSGLGKNKMKLKLFFAFPFNLQQLDVQLTIELV